MITRHDNSGTLTNSNLSTALGSYSDTDILYSVSGGALTVSGSGTELYIPTSHSFAPGGNVTTPAMKSAGTFNGGSYAIDINDTLTITGGTHTASSGTTYIGGDFTVSSGTFTHNSGTIVLDGANAWISAAGATLNNLTVNKATYRTAVSLGASLSVAGTVKVTQGYLILGSTYSLTAGTITISAYGRLKTMVLAPSPWEAALPITA